MMGCNMPKTTKPQTGWEPVRGTKRDTADIPDKLNPITPSSQFQLFGKFDHDSFSAFIVLAGDVPVKAVLNARTELYHESTWVLR
jgi:hypothetical protein